MTVHWLSAARVTTITFLAAASACVLRPPARSRETIALVGATVIHVDGRAPMRNATLVVEGHRIVSVGPASEARVPGGATRVDLAGAFIVPGLWDMHTHLSKARASALSILVAHGVTSVRDMGGEHQELLRWRDDIQAGRRVGPRMLIAGPYFESPANVQRLRRSSVAQVAEPVERTRVPIGSRADAERVIDSIVRLGVDHVKIRSVASVAVYREIAAVARERGKPLVGHGDALPMAEVVANGQHSVEHAVLPQVDGLSPDEQRNLAAQYAGSGSALVPTLVTGWRSILLDDSVVQRLFDQSTTAGNPRRPRVSRFLEVDWREQLSERDSTRRRIIARIAPGLLDRVRELRALGVPVLPGSDLAVLPLYPGESLHDELGLMTTLLGMTPLEALSSATRGAATFAGLGDSVGTIAPGLVADLVVLDGDPLLDIENVRRIRGVMLGGRWLSRTALDALLAGVERAEDVRTMDWIR